MKALSFICFGLLFASVALAQVDTSQFSIRVFGGEDLDPPSTPTLLAVTPIASTQIDISWSVATDNFALGGYVLYRDDVPYATTTQTSFSDTGLTPSTTYQYYVQAFDVAGNYSATSTTLSTTTPDTPPPPPPPPSPATTTTNGGTAARVTLDELVITPGFSTTSFSITTARPARFEVRWGRTASYELGFIATERFLNDYRTTLTDLEPGTTYEYEVIGYSPQGIPAVLERGQFRTLGAEQSAAPENVIRFNATAQNTDVALTWQIPAAQNIAYIRIVRSHLRYPTHLQDGAVVYQGNGSSYIDKAILAEYSPVYYTVFVVDTNGRTSSGAIARVFALEADSEGEESVPIVPPEPEITEAERVLPEFKMPDQTEIFVIQNGVLASFGEDVLTVRSDQPFLLSIPKSAVAKNLKTIIATLTDPTDNRKSYSFLLRINNEDTAYEATVASLQLEGLSGLTITIYDYEARVVGTRSQMLTFEASRDVMQPVFWPDTFVQHWPAIGSISLLMLLLMTAYVFYRRTL